MENFLNLNKLVEGEEYRLERKMIWIYLWLLIFEGALRKWFLPGLAQPLLLVREPIVIFLMLRALQGRMITSTLARVMMFVSTISLIMTFFVGHHDAFVGFYGWRIYFFHFPFMYILGHVLMRDDLMKMMRFILLLSIPMTALVVMQFYSPQSAWVNQGIGGDEEGAGFSGALGYFRPPGTFSFISGYVCYQGVVCASLLYYLMNNNNMDERYKFSPVLLYTMAVCFLISIPTSISRGHMMQTVVFLAFLALATLRSDYLKVRFVRFALYAMIAILLVLSSGIADTQMDAFMHRFESANNSEGGMAEGVVGDRYLGSFVRGVENALKMPTFGHGIGIGTNAGAKLMKGDGWIGFNGEEEWSRVTGECGLLLGWTIIFIRVLFSLDIWRSAYRYLTKEHDFLPWMLACGVLLNVPQGQWGVPTNLGFCILFGGFALAAINTYEEEENEDEEEEYNDNDDENEHK